MKTLLIRPSLVRGSVVDMPLSILVLGSYIKGTSDVIVWDFPVKYGIPLTKENYLNIFERFKDDLASEEPDVVGISCTSGDEYIPTLKVARAVKDILPSATAIAGGYHASSCAEEMLRESKGLDCIVIGEGEEPLRRIVQNRVNKKKALQDVPGILALKGNDVFRTEPVYIDLNDIPFIDLELVEYVDAYPSISLELSRGCPYKCNFCQGPSIPRRGVWRAKNPERAVSEIEYLVSKSGSKYLFFYDPLFGANDKWTINTCHDIVQRKLDINWFAMVRATLRKDTLLMMGKAGAYSLFYGLESGSQRILTLMDKLPASNDYTDYLKRARQTFRDSVEHQIIPAIGVVIGYPGENQRTMRETKHYLETVVKECKTSAPDVAVGIDPMFYLPLPKSRGFELLDFYEKEFGTRIIINEWWKKDFPFFNYFYDISVIPSRDVTLYDLKKQRESLCNMSNFTEKSARRSFWCYSHTHARELLRLRRTMEHADNFQLRHFSEIALAEWKKQQSLPYKISIANKLSRAASNVLSRFTKAGTT